MGFMKRSGFARLMAAMLVAGLAFGMLASCDDDDDDDDSGPVLVQTLSALDEDSEVIFVASFYDNNTWIARDDEGIALMEGTYTGNPAPSGTVNVTATHYLDDDGNWSVAPSKPAQAMTVDAHGVVTNLSAVQTWINSFYE